MRFWVLAGILLAIAPPALGATSSTDWDNNIAKLKRDAELPYLFDRLKMPAYRRSLLAVMKGPKVESWARKIVTGGVALSGPGRHVTIGGKAFEAYNACTQRMCSAFELRVIYKPGGEQAWAVQKEAGGEGTSGQAIPDEVVFFGNPDEAMRKALLAELDR